MFRHKNPTNQTAENKPSLDDKKNTVVETPVVLHAKSVVKKESPKTENEVIKELLEKNLKWSQIIYEQNRKINSKLMWASIASWFRLLIIIVPLILAIWFLPPIIQNLFDTYGGLLGGKINSATSLPNTNSIDQLLKTLPIDPAKQEQLKALLK